MVALGFLQKFLQKDKEQEFREEMESYSQSKEKKAPEEKTESFEKFLKDAETQKKIKEWTTQWKYKKRGVMALLYILWLRGDSNKEILKAAKDILSKLKGEDIFAKLLNVLKLAPEDKME